MKRFLLFLLCIYISLLFFGCGREGISRIEINPLQTPQSGFGVSWNEPESVPSLKPYEVRTDLSEVVNRENFPELDELDEYMLSSNLFTIKKSATVFEQPFDLYIRNYYEGVPNFISCDSIIHVYHLMYDYILMNLEKERLIGELKEFTSSAFEKSMIVYNGITRPEIKEAALKNIAYFGIAMKLMGMDLPGGIPLEANRIIDNDVKRVKVRWGDGSSEIFPYYIDYTKYVARGRYSRVQDYNNYFLTMMWYGNTPLMFETYDGKSGNYSRMDEQIAMAVIMSSSILGDDKLRALWEDIYDVTSQFSGRTEDVNLYDMSDIIKVMYGNKIDLDTIWDNDMLQKVFELSKQRYNMHSGETISGRINLLDTNNKSQTQFRLMGQIYDIREDIYNNLIFPDVSHINEIHTANGLDIPCAFGSDDALSLLREQMEGDEMDVQSTLYMQRLRGVLSGAGGDNPGEYSFNNSAYWVLKSLIKPSLSGCPSFMGSDSWTVKKLLTFSGAISDVTHPTFLEAKQGDIETEENKVGCETCIPGYVEPETDFYARLEYTAGCIKSFLSSKNFKNADIYSVLDSFKGSVSLLKNISIKELANESFSDEERRRLQYFGEDLQSLSLKMVESKNGQKDWSLIPSVDRNMASVSDAYINGSNVLQTAVGNPDYIYVVVPYNNELYLTRGEVYSYYEFEKTLSQKLDDREWQNMLKDGKEIDQQIWIKKIRY